MYSFKLHILLPPNLLFDLGKDGKGVRNVFFDFTMELPSHISFDNQLKTHFLLTLPNTSVLMSRRAVQLLLQVRSK